MRKTGLALMIIEDFLFLKLVLGLSCFTRLIDLVAILRYNASMTSNVDVCQRVSAVITRSG